MATTNYHENVSAKAGRFVTAAEAHAAHYAAREGGTDLLALEQLRDTLNADPDSPMWDHIGDIATALHYAANCVTGSTRDPRPVRFHSSRSACLRALNDRIRDRVALATTAPVAVPADVFEGL